MPLPMPEQFGRYRILKLLGQGGMGAVYLANDSQLGRDVALKIPALDGPDAEQMIERFAREARAAATLHHPNICPVYDVGEIDGKPYLTMRYIEGRPLTRFINPDKPQNPKNVAVVIRKLALALEEAHKHGVVHRDLKPANVMIDAKNEPVVMDFGLARQMGGANEKQVTQSGMIVGTPAYMSPEQIVAEPSQIDHRTDIWSLGVILFEMLTGQLPYDGSVLQIVGTIQHIDPPLASDKRPALPEKVVTICRKMMTRDRAQRYQSMNEAAVDLAAFIKDAGGTLVASAGSTSDGALQSMALRTGNEPHTQTPRSLMDVMATGAMPAATSASKKTGHDAGALATLMQSIVRSSSALLRGRRKAKNGKSPQGKKAANNWVVPSAAVLCVLMLIGVIYAMSGRNEKPSTSTNNSPYESIAASSSGPQPSAVNPQPASGWHGWPAEAPKPAIAPFDAAQAKKYQEEWAAYLKVPVEYENSIGMKFRLIPPGEFLQGSPQADADALPVEKPQHPVEITTPFYLGSFEVTQKEWTSVMGTRPWKGKPNVREGDRFPASWVNWNEAQDYCRKLNSAQKGDEYRLPTEAEWEFACRAGTTTRYYFGDDASGLKDYAWFGDTTKKGPDAFGHEVGLKRSNPFGLFDMSGNLFEWCSDWHQDEAYKTAEKVDPKGPASGGYRVFRGGCWHIKAASCRSAHRNGGNTNHRESDVGFRVAISVESVRTQLLNSVPKPAIAPFDAAQAKKHQENWAAHLKLPVEFENSLGMKFRLIPPGESIRGSTDPSAGKDESPEHRVRITQPFLMGATEVTQSDWRMVMKRSPSHFALTGEGKGSVDALLTDSFPVERISWFDAIEFCNTLSESEKRPPYYRLDSPRRVYFPNNNSTINVANVVVLGGVGYRLPTEAEWEYASRAGSSTLFSFGDTSNGTESNINGEGPLGTTTKGPNLKRTTAVGSYGPNPFGLYDMHGNVWEWCYDWHGAESYKPFDMSQAVNPQGPETGQFRIVRGGSYAENAWVSRSAERGTLVPDWRSEALGFRIVRAVGDAGEPISTDTKRVTSAVVPNVTIAPPPKPAVAPFDAAQAKTHQDEWAAHLKLPVEYTNSVGMKFRLVPPGEFTMGSTREEIDGGMEQLKQVVGPSGDLWRDSLKSEAPRHRVVLKQPFYLAVTETTRRQYQTVRGEVPSKPYGVGEENRQTILSEEEAAEHPVQNVSWKDAATFCTRLSEKERLKPNYFVPNSSETPSRLSPAEGYILPTEAQWEFACRAGTDTCFWKGDHPNGIVEIGWIAANSLFGARRVGKLPANPFGFHDMHGNVMEWCQDIWRADTYRTRPDSAIDPVESPRPNESWRDWFDVRRGGAYSSNSELCRSGSRQAARHGSFGSMDGFRVALSVEGVRSLLSRQGTEAPASAVAPFDAAQAKKHQEEWAAHLKLPVEYENSLGMKFRLVPPGEFTMGSPKAEIAAAKTFIRPWDKESNPAAKRWKESLDSESPQHKVVLTKPFYLAVHETTWKQYDAVMERKFQIVGAIGDEGEPVDPANANDHPASFIPWGKAATFCVRLSEKEGLESNYGFRGRDDPLPSRLSPVAGYALPTEAQWEFACRAGTETCYWKGDHPDSIVEVGWIYSNSLKGTRRVGGKPANPFGFHDMLGNVGEWCHDVWRADSYTTSESPVVDPAQVLKSGESLTDADDVLRGGGHSSWPVFARAGSRNHYKGAFNSETGFRAMLPVEAVRSLVAKAIGKATNHND